MNDTRHFHRSYWWMIAAGFSLAAAFAQSPSGALTGVVANAGTGGFAPSTNPSDPPDRICQPTLP